MGKNSLLPPIQNNNPPTLLATPCYEFSVKTKRQPVRGASWGKSEHMFVLWFLLTKVLISSSNWQTHRIPPATFGSHLSHSPVSRKSFFSEICLVQKNRCSFPVDKKKGRSPGVSNLLSALIVFCSSSPRPTQDKLLISSPFLMRRQTDKRHRVGWRWCIKVTLKRKNKWFCFSTGTYSACLIFILFPPTEKSVFCLCRVAANLSVA